MKYIVNFALLKKEKGKREQYQKKKIHNIFHNN